MKTFVLSRSASFERHLGRVLGDLARPRVLRSPQDLVSRLARDGAVVLVHARSFPAELTQMLPDVTRRAGAFVGIASDRPELEEMLNLSGHGIRAYFNSYMGDSHYEQMLRLLENGQTWFVPQLLTRALALARRTVATTTNDEVMGPLTPREREIALDVAQGLSNKKIAAHRRISEYTVKTHLSRIFKKLQTRDRVALAVKLGEHAR